MRMPGTLSVLPLGVAYMSSRDARRKGQRMPWFWWVLVALVPVVALVGFTALLFCEWVARVAAGEFEDEET